jgi:hypothetical protein
VSGVDKWIETNQSLCTHLAKGYWQDFIHRNLTKLFHQHHQWYHSPINESWPLVEFFLGDSQQISFYKVRLSASNPTPKLEDSIFIPSGDRVAQLYPRYWVARVPRDHHFLYPLMWAPEGKHFLMCFNFGPNITYMKTWKNIQTAHYYSLWYSVVCQMFHSCHLWFND